MTLKLASEKKEEPKEIYLSFSELIAKKQAWVEEKLAQGHRVFLLPRRGRTIELTLVKYN